MKKEYKTPTAEKVELNYANVVTASGSGEADANTEKGNPYYYCTCDPYYAEGWGQNC